MWLFCILFLFIINFWVKLKLWWIWSAGKSSKWRIWFRRTIAFIYFKSFDFCSFIFILLSIRLICHITVLLIERNLFLNFTSWETFAELNRSNIRDLTNLYSRHRCETTSRPSATKVILIQNPIILYFKLKIFHLFFIQSLKLLLYFPNFPHHFFLIFLLNNLDLLLQLLIFLHTFTQKLR